jgi:hypothetical protein
MKIIIIFASREKNNSLFLQSNTVPFMTTCATRISGPAFLFFREDIYFTRGISHDTCPLLRSPSPSLRRTARSALRLYPGRLTAFAVTERALRLQRTAAKNSAHNYAA